MKKLTRIVSCITLIPLSGSAFAQPNISNSALETIITNTDAQFAPAMNRAMEPQQAVTLPPPSVSQAEPRYTRLIDITEKCTYLGEVVSEYPGIYKMIQSEENSRIIRVFNFTDPRGIERRIEVYFTGGDWMRYGLIYIVTNAGQSKNQANAYFISDLSTSDREEGSVAPRIDPFDSKKLANFISADFLDAQGNVKAVFKSIATVSASAK